MLGKLAEVPERHGNLPFADVARWVPDRIELHRVSERGALLRHGSLLVDDRERGLEVMVHRFARDEQAHDLRRPLEDQVDPRVTHCALDWNRPLSSGPERVSSLKAAP